MDSIIDRTESRGAAACLRRMSFVPVMLMIAMLAAVLSMGEARAAGFETAHDGVSQHCPAMAMADETGADHMPDASHPMTKTMNCAMTCAFILNAAPMLEMPLALYGTKQPMVFSALPDGISGHLDLPPPKG